MARFQARQLAGPGGGGFAVWQQGGIAGINAPLASNRLVLKDGKPKASPTAYVGAARVRAVSDAKQGQGPAREGEAVIGLQFSLEPKIAWRRLTSLRLDRAVDDQDQSLESTAEPEADQGQAFRAFGGGGGGGGGAVAFVGVAGRGHELSSGTSLFSSLRLKKGEKQAKLLKELKGTLTAEVLGPVKPVITVEKLIEAAGKTFKGDGGVSVEVLEVSKGDDDQLTVKLALHPAADATPGIAIAGVAAAPLPAFPAPGGVLPVVPPAPAAKLPPRVAPAAGAIVAGVPANTQESEISLLDAKGKALQTTRHIVSFRGGDKGWEHLHEFALQLPKGQDTVKLVVSGRTPATIDIPFTLKDVPLP
ncbi:MAG TPA: hypothetical protein VKE94_10295 [Gemmataceae bacterium]|nr:hypothetical protein [Gemmataceae bacterium]